MFPYSNLTSDTSLISSLALDRTIRPEGNSLGVLSAALVRHRLVHFRTEFGITYQPYAAATFFVPVSSYLEL